MAEPFRPNIFQPAPPRVSTTDPQFTKKSHLHLHNHRKPHQHHRHSSRHHAKEAVQSAIQLHPPTSFGDLLNKAKGGGSNTSSRPESVQVDAQSEAAREQRQEEVRKLLRPEDVEAERRRAKAREEELQVSLQKLSEQSLKTSRRIDDIYYSLLERASDVHQTLGNLQDLANLTKELQEHFDADTNEIIEDTKSQLDAFENFDKQKKQVAVLEARIKAGREKADGLNARLIKAKETVEARAKSEAELEARNIRRLRILWGLICGVTLVILLAVLFQQFRPSKPHHEHEALDFSSRERILDAPIPDIAKEAILSSASRTTTPGVLSDTPAKSMTEPGEDDRFRVFDEL